jgi:WhiB family redox-sensing transcriptional regulator
MRDSVLIRPAPGPESLHFSSVDWMSQGACVGAEDILWYHDTGRDGSDRATRHAAAIAICQGCPVLALCATWADAHDEVGVWGGKCRDGVLGACGSCRRDHQLSLSTEVANRRRERNAAAERARYAAMSDEERAARRAKRYATPELREAAKQRHLAWKARRTAERVAADKRADCDRARRAS